MEGNGDGDGGGGSGGSGGGAGGHARPRLARQAEGKRAGTGHEKVLVLVDPQPLYPWASHWALVSVQESDAVR